MGLCEKGYKLDETVELDDAMVTGVKEQGSPGHKVKDEGLGGHDKKIIAAGVRKKRGWCWF